MSSIPKPAAARKRAAMSTEPGHRTPGGHPSPGAQIAGGETQSPTPASPAAVFISERQVMLATAAAGAAAQTAITRHRWINLAWLRRSPRSELPRERRRYYPSSYRLYLENAAMARAMERL